MGEVVRAGCGERRCWIGGELDRVGVVERTILGDENGAGKLRQGYTVRGRGRTGQVRHSPSVKCAGRVVPPRGVFVNARDDVALALRAI
ncbi:MAG: hypothetical protein MUQ65_17830 [Armatimonadetes bacterium]|nr:hypothetical protein [Armatimonadota bacterium]